MNKESLSIKVDTGKLLREIARERIGPVRPKQIIKQKKGKKAKYKEEYE